MLVSKHDHESWSFWNNFSCLDVTDLQKIEIYLGTKSVGGYSRVTLIFLFRSKENGKGQVCRMIFFICFFALEEPVLL